MQGRSSGRRGPTSRRPPVPNAMRSALSTLASATLIASERLTGVSSTSGRAFMPVCALASRAPGQTRNASAASSSSQEPNATAPASPSDSMAGASVGDGPAGPGGGSLLEAFARQAEANQAQRVKGRQSRGAADKDTAMAAISQVSLTSSTDPIQVRLAAKSRGHVRLWRARGGCLAEGCLSSKGCLLCRPCCWLSRTASP